MKSNTIFIYNTSYTYDMYNYNIKYNVEIIIKIRNNYSTLAHLARNLANSMMIMHQLEKNKSFTSIIWTCYLECNT